jgi:hypothetical protein
VRRQRRRNMPIRTGSAGRQLLLAGVPRRRSCCENGGRRRKRKLIPLHDKDLSPLAVLTLIGTLHIRLCLRVRADAVVSSATPSQLRMVFLARTGKRAIPSASALMRRPDSLRGITGTRSTTESVTSTSTIADAGRCVHVHAANRELHAALTVEDGVCVRRRMTSLGVANSQRAEALRHRPIVGIGKPHEAGSRHGNDQSTEPETVECGRFEAWNAPTDRARISTGPCQRPVDKCASISEVHLRPNPDDARVDRRRHAAEG